MTDTPDNKARAAAEAIATRGEAVTAEAIAQECGVHFALARAAASSWAWRASQNAEATIPPVPEVIEQRLALIWTDAWRTAKASFAGEREQMRQATQQIIDERDLLAKALAEAEERAGDVKEQVDELFAQHKVALTQRNALEDKHRALAKELEQQRAHTEQAEAALDAMTAERDRLADLRNLIAQHEGANA